MSVSTKPTDVCHPYRQPSCGHTLTHPPNNHHHLERFSWHYRRRPAALRKLPTAGDSRQMPPPLLFKTPYGPVRHKSPFCHVRIQPYTPIGTRLESKSPVPEDTPERPLLPSGTTQTLQCCRQCLRVRQIYTPPLPNTAGRDASSLSNGPTGAPSLLFSPLRVPHTNEPILHRYRTCSHNQNSSSIVVYVLFPNFDFRQS